ncbi:hypothetical protein WBJ53_15255 [Spirosoma sp. SC4-14]|uniref:hypothetical protein n=1 Tax=Spirosoma sp. SC4-14 TaxID=3128900 RepID=UPI0030CEFB17
MTLSQRLRTFFRPKAASEISPPVLNPTGQAVPQPGFIQPTITAPQWQPLPTVSGSSSVEPLPYWLTDEETLRDEGVLYGLSTAEPDEKIAEISAYFAYQTAPLEATIEQLGQKAGEYDQLIEQLERRVAIRQQQITILQNQEPAQTHLLRTGVSLTLSAVVCIGNYYLIDHTLHPAFSNTWITAGVFLAGMFNLFGRTSFFYEEGTRLSGRRLIEETGLPLSASIFILVQALQTQSTLQACSLFVFVFMLFLLAGKLVLSTLTTLEAGLKTAQLNRRLAIDKQQKIPAWETGLDQLRQEISHLQAEKWPVATAQKQADSQRAQLNTQRDRLVNLFLSEFELARSLRNRLTEQQRQAIFN